MRLRPFLILATCLASLPVLARTAVAKPKVAILGLEVTGTSSTDQKAIRAADDLTKELRREAQRDSGPYDLAPNSNKSLLDIKTLTECSDEGLKCMSEIGQQMGADRLVYGKLERKKGGYEVTLKLLNTDSRKSEGTASATIPFSEVGSGGLARRARSLYGNLIGAPDEGGLDITSNAERGTVFVDGEIKTSLSAGSARVSGLASGEHTIAIEADGYERYETDVTIAPGGSESLRASLVPLGGDDGGDEGGRPGRGWRIAFWSGVVAAGVGGGGWAYSGLQVLSAQDDVDTASRDYSMGDMLTPPPSGGEFDNACDSFDSAPTSGLSPDDQSAVNRVHDACDRGKQHQKLVNFLWMPMTIGAAVFSGFAYYKGYVQPKRISAEREARRHRRRAKKRNFVVAPTLGPDLIGAGLGIQF
jgi:PEGA domain-containing protein